MCGVERQCSDCGQWLAPSQFERLVGAKKVSFRKNCRGCRNRYLNRLQQRARQIKRDGWPMPTPYIPPLDFLPMGAAEHRALVASVGNRVCLPAYEQRWAA